MSDTKTNEATSGETKPKDTAVEATVEVSKSFLENLSNQMKTLTEKTELLEKIADKRQLARYYQRNQNKLPSKFGLRLIDGKVILGWRMLEDKGSYKHLLTGAWTESQTLELIYNVKDKEGKLETQQMQQREFVRRWTRVEATLVSKKEDAVSGNLILELKRDDNGEKVNIDVRYVN